MLSYAVLSNVHAWFRNIEWLNRALRPINMLNTFHTHTVLFYSAEFQNGSGVSVIRKNQGLLVEKCRFLESAGCAKTCLHACKIPTQRFFLEEMGLPVTLLPNMTDFRYWGGVRCVGVCCIVVCWSVYAIEYCCALWRDLQYRKSGTLFNNA